MRTFRQQTFILLTFMLGLVFYMFGILSSFGSSLGTPEFYEIILVTVIGGLVSLGLGYISIVVFGGIASLRLVEFVSKFTRAKHIVELADERQPTLQGRMSRHVMVIAMPILIFLLSVGITWDVHNLHDPSTWIFHSVLHALDVFSKPLIADPLYYSIEIVLVMVVLVVIAGVIPSLVFPYFRRFKVTGINSGPFHTDLLINLVGFVVGLSALLTLIGVLFEVMWVGQGPSYYHYVIPVMMGLSLHYTIGMFMGRDKSEDMVETLLETHSGERVLKGTINIQRHARDENSRSDASNS